MAYVTHDNGRLFIECPFFDVRAKQAPNRKWDSSSRRWVLPLVEATAKYVNTRYKNNEIEPETTKAINAILHEAAVAESEPFPSWYKFKNPPMDHQMEALNLAWGKEAFALFMEMGTGKTYCAINWASAMAMDGKVNGMLVLCPTSIKPVWMHEIETHCPTDVDVHVIEAGGRQPFERWVNKEQENFRVLIAGIESLSQGVAYDLCIDFMIRHRCAVIVDESSRIKTPNATRTKRCIELGNAATGRMILTGTPVTQGMQDLFAQFRFLDWRIIGQRSYFSFQNRYCVMGGFEGRNIVGYTNVDELMELISPYTYIVKKEDVLDLPPKVYESIVAKPNKDQAKVLKDLGDKYLMASNLGDLDLEVETILERMTRYQQVVGGLFPYDKEDGTHGVVRIPGKNPKLEVLVDTISDLDNSKKVIIWARFKEEQKMIVERMREEYGPDSVAWFKQGTTTDERKQMISDFQSPLSSTRFFVSNPTMGGIGLTLTAAEFMFYYSNSFSLEDRLQSEDRAHRKGQTKSLTIVDIMMDHQIDKDIVKALKMKKSVADYVEDAIRGAQ